jgi:hypothetical protein
MFLIHWREKLGKGSTFLFKIQGFRCRRISKDLRQNYLKIVFLGILALKFIRRFLGFKWLVEEVLRDGIECDFESRATIAGSTSSLFYIGKVYERFYLSWSVHVL